MPPVNLFFSTFNASFLLPGNFKLLRCGVFVPACHQQYHSCYLESLNIDVLQGFVTERYGWADCTFHRRCLVSLHGVFKAQISFTRLIQISLELSWSHFHKAFFARPVGWPQGPNSLIQFVFMIHCCFSRSQMVQQFLEETVSTVCILASHLDVRAKLLILDRWRFLQPALPLEEWLTMLWSWCKTVACWGFSELSHWAFRQLVLCHFSRNVVFCKDSIR